MEEKKELNKLRASVKYLSTDADHPINIEKIEIFISSFFFEINLSFPSNPFISNSIKSCCYFIKVIKGNPIMSFSVKININIFFGGQKMHNN